MKKRLFTLLRILISLSLIGFLLWLMRDKLPAIATTIRTADRGFLLLGFFVYLSAIILIALRLKRVISVQLINLSVREAIYLTFIGYFFNNFLPTSFGGDLLKAYYAGKKSNKKAGAFAGVFMDRVVAMLPFTLIPAVAVTFFAHRIDNKALIFVIYAIFITSAAVLWLLLHKKTAMYFAVFFAPFRKKFWYEKLKAGYGFLNLYVKHKIILLWSFLLSIAAQACAIISTFLFAKAIGVDFVSLGIYFIIVPIVWIMTLLPSLNGLGIREGAFVYLLKAYMPAEKAFAISILVLASLAVFGVIGGIIYGFKKNVFTLNREDLK